MLRREKCNTVRRHEAFKALACARPGGAPGLERDHGDIPRFIARTTRRIGLAAAILCAGSVAAATITISGVSCVAATTNADGSGNVTISCGAAVPGAPVLGAVTPGNTQATIAFSAGSGAAATSYTATCTDGGVTRSTTGSASPLTVSGLTNGSTYTCSVTASNAAGSSSPSASLSVQPHGTTPATAPGAPTIGVATPGDTTASLAFTPPVSDGGSAIDLYQATCTPGATATTPAASPIALSALTNGTTYTCYVRAHNAIGYGPASATVNVTPVLGVGATAPGAPTAVSATAGNGMASIAFTAPAASGGQPILDYTATCTAGSSFIVTGSASPIVVTGLSNNTLYSCTVTARNAVGSSAASAPPATVTPVAPAAGTAPPTMGAPTATALNASISVAFTPDLSGTAHLYRATCGGFTASGLGSPLVVSGLSNGTGYTCTVAAHNAFGWSAESPASASATPAAPTAPSAPPKPTLATAGSGQLNVTFSAPASPGTIGGTTAATITGYTVTCAPSGSNTGASSPITVSGLLNGTSYTCTVKATNSAALTGPDSVASDPVAPVAGTPPGAPTIGTATVTAPTTVSVSYAAGTAGSSATDNYRATCTSSDGGATQTATSGSGTVTPISVASLTAGKTYTCTAAAHNATGWSPESAASNTIVLIVPNAPTIGTATAGNASASVPFTAPGANGGPAIDSYRATCSPGGITGTGAGSPVTVSGLTNGTGYTCTVAAHNVVGYSAESAASNSVTPSSSCTFPVSGTEDAVWSGFNGGTTYPAGGDDFLAVGTTGVALQFVPTANRGVQMSVGVVGPNPAGSADVTISTCAHDFSSEVGGQGIYCKRTNVGDLNTIWISITGTQPNGNECMLTSGGTYYYNIRPHDGTSISKQIGATYQ